MKRLILALALLLGVPAAQAGGPVQSPPCTSNCALTGTLTQSGGVFSFGSASAGFSNNNSDSALLAQAIGTSYLDNTISLQNTTYTTVGSVTATIGDTRASFTGTIAPATFNTSTMTVTGWSGGLIIVGSRVQGTGVFAFNRVLSQQSGTTGQNGTYTISGGNQTAGPVAMQALYGTLNVTVVGSGSVSVGNWVIAIGASPPIPRATRILQRGTGVGATGTYFINTTGLNMSSQNVVLGGALGQSSVRFLGADNSELSAVFQNPQANADVLFGTGSINAGDIYGRGFGTQLSYATLGNTGPLPDGQNYVVFHSASDGGVQMNTMNGSNVSGYINRWSMVGGVGATQGYIGIGSQLNGVLAPLYPFHLLNTALHTDDDGLGTHDLIVGVTGTQPTIQTNQTSVAVRVGSDTLGSGTLAASFSATAASLAGTVTAAGLSTAGTIAGSICATSGGLILYEAGATGCTISLEELKHDIAPLDPPTWKFMALRPIEFTLDQPGSKPRVGFGAHQIEDVDPRLSTYDGSGKLQAYDPNGILAMTVAVVQQQERQLIFLTLLTLLWPLILSLMIRHRISRLGMTPISPATAPTGPSKE